MGRLKMGKTKATVNPRTEEVTIVIPLRELNIVSDITISYTVGKLDLMKEEKIRHG